MFTPKKRSQPTIFFTFLFMACLLLCGIASAAPSITLSKKTGPPTSQILVSGRGFKPNVGVDIYFDTKDEALVVTNGQGEFEKAEIHAPRGARPGEHWVTALERNNDKGAQERFLVQTDWSQFLFSPDHHGTNPFENVLGVPNVRGLRVNWRYATKHRIPISPVVSDGILFLGSFPDVGKNTASFYALDSHTGSVLWKHTGNDGYQAGAAVFNDIVYVPSETGNLYAFQARTGTPLWTYNTGADIESSPAVANGIVYIANYAGSVNALNAKTGALLWNYSVGYYGFSSTAVAEGTVYVGSDLNHSLYALDAATGVLLWSFKTGGPIASSPAIANGVVYFTSGDGHVYALNALTGNPLWEYPRVTAYISFADSSPAVANGVVYVGSGDYTEGDMFALDANTGGLIWQYEIGTYINSSPALANGVLYFGAEDGNIYALDAASGVLLWRYGTRGAVESSPAVADGIVYIGGYDGNIYAFSLKRGDSSGSSDLAPRRNLKQLRPDFSLKVSKPVTTPTGAKR